MWSPVAELAASIFIPEDGGRMFLRNAGNRLPDYTTLNPKRPQS
jgi:hypothetical protein